MTKETRWKPIVQGLTLIGGAGLLTALAARARANANHRRADAAPPVILPPPVVTAAPPVEPPPEKPAAALRPWMYLALLLACAVGLVLLQSAAPGAAGALFVLLIAGALGVAAWQARPALAAQVNRWRRWRLPSVSLMPSAAGWSDRRRALAAGVLVLVAVGLLALSAWSFQIARLGMRPLDEPLFFLVTGIAALWGALSLRREAAGDMPAQAGAAAQAGAVRRLPLGLGVALLAVLAESNGEALQLAVLHKVSPHIQMVLLVTGLALVVWGLRGRVAPVYGAEDEKADSGGRWRGMALLGAILLLAFGLRYWQLGTAVRYLVDEMNTVPEVIAFQYPEYPVKLLTQMSGISPFPWVFAYGQWAGTLFLGDTLEGMRLASTFTGTFTVLALYVLARSLFDRTTALMAALLLATFPPHLHFSRLALLNIADPLFGTFALAFLARGLVQQRRVDYALGGVFLGLTQYFYNGGRLFYLPLALVWVGLLIVLTPRAPVPEGTKTTLPGSLARVVQRLRGIRVNWGGLGVALLALLISAAPIYYTALATGQPVIGRMEASGLGPDYWRGLIADGRYDEYLYRLGRAFRFYMQNPDDTIYYGGDTPLVLPLLLPAFLLGVGYCLHHGRRPGPLLLALWLVAGAVGNSILIMSAASTRFVIVFPALALLAAVGIRYTLPLIWPPRWPALALRLKLGARWARLRWPPRDVPRHLRRSALALAACAAVYQGAYYWGPHLELYNRQLRIHHGFPDGYDAIFRAVEFPRGTQVHIISASPFSQMDAQGLADYLRGPGWLVVDTRTPAEAYSLYLRGLPCGMDHAFFIQPDDMRTLAKLQRFFYLRPPAYSPNSDIIPDERELVLYYAPYLRGLEAAYGRTCE